MTRRTFDARRFVALHLIGAETVTRDDVPLVRFAPPEDPSNAQAMRLVEASGALDFWRDAREDVYGPEDGEPV